MNCPDCGRNLALVGRLRDSTSSAPLASTVTIEHRSGWSWACTTRFAILSAEIAPFGGAAGETHITDIWRPGLHRPHAFDSTQPEFAGYAPFACPPAII